MSFNFKTFSHSPLGAVIKVAIVVLGGEFLIMVAIEGVFAPLFGRNVPAGFWEFMDPILLTFIVAPVLHFSVLRPMKMQQLQLERQKNELTRSEENFRSIVDQIIFGIVQSDISGHITYVNDRYCEMTGYSSEELIGKNWQDLTHPDDLSRNVATYQQNITTGKPYEIEKRYLRKNGGVLWVSIGASLRHKTGSDQFDSTAIVMDITERKLMEKEIQERREEMELLQKLQVSNQTASAIAHELNQPLLAISAYSRAAIMMCSSAKPDLDEICNALEASEQQAHRAGLAIHDILYSLKTKEFAAEALDINKEIVGSIDAARSEDDLQFNLILNLEQALPLVRANRLHVQKVLLNLLHNSIDAMREAGVPLPAITVSVRKMKDESVAHVTIQDNGPGIKKEDSHRLFEPFFTTKTKGIGMGLAISRSLIEENGGQLWVDPQGGSGATFHLTLPFAS